MDGGGEGNWLVATGENITTLSGNRMMRPQASGGLLERFVFVLFYFFDVFLVVCVGVLF